MKALPGAQFFSGLKGRGRMYGLLTSLPPSCFPSLKLVLGGVIQPIGGYTCKHVVYMLDVPWIWKWDVTVWSLRICIVVVNNININLTRYSAQPQRAQGGFYVYPAPKSLPSVCAVLDFFVLKKTMERFATFWSVFWNFCGLRKATWDMAEIIFKLETSWVTVLMPRHYIRLASYETHCWYNG